MTRLLFISGSVGLGHVVRDLAVAAALRQLRPDVEVSWLAGHPATEMLEAAGERLLPECDQFTSETADAEAVASGYGMDLTRYVLRARRTWKANAELYRRLATSGRFDAIVGDEIYEFNIAQLEDPDVNPLPYVCLFDFLGMDVAGRNPISHLIAYRWNWTWARDGALFGRPRRTAAFVGELDDVPDRRFGPFLPYRRRHAMRYYRFVGYILGFDPAAIGDRRLLRASLGYGEEPLVLCSVGGTAVGADLLSLCAEAYPALQHRIPGVRLVLVAGPRIDPDSVRVPPGVEVRGYVPELYRHLAASDLSVVQAGGTTTLELTALRRPFLYFPLEGHAEQEVAVAGRLARHQAGVPMALRETTPEILADQIARTIDQPVVWPEIDVDGARHAAGLVCDIL